jgi:hypothetical protein
VGYKTWGLLTILMHLGAEVLGLCAIIPYSVPHALVYFGVMLVTTLLIVYSFCSKCPCHARQCSHVILGPVARILPKRRTGRYTRTDYLALATAFLASILYPEYWLWKYDYLPFIFYLIVIATISLILLKVCPHCKNVNCPFNRHPKNPKYRSASAGPTVP